MKKYLLLLLAFTFTASYTTKAATIMLEDFEDDTINYVIGGDAGNNMWTDGNEDYFLKTDGSNIGGGASSYTNPQGSSFFTFSDIDADAAAPLVPGPGTIDTTGVVNMTLTFTVDITGYTNLSFSGFFAEDDDGAAQDWDASDSFLVTYDIDGGGTNNLFGLEANIASGSNGTPLEDTDFDGVGDGTEVTDAFAQFTKAIAGTGSTLTLTFNITNFDSGDEDLAFDNIEVTGDLVPEPSSAMLMLFGIVPFIIFRRRLSFLTQTK